MKAIGIKNGRGSADAFFIEETIQLQQKVAS
jgi:hypothetical protein